MIDIEVEGFKLKVISENHYEGSFFEEGGCEYILNGDKWELWETPAYGGIPCLYKTYKTLSEAVLVGENFT